MNPARGPFDRDAAAHLLRRAAFVAMPDEITRAVADGLEATVQRLVPDGPPAANPAALAAERAVEGSDDRDLLAGALLWRATVTTEPFRESAVLFWHNHFVSALSKVRDGRLLLGQLETLRTHGLGPFVTLTQAVARDPAMVRYLDAERSTKTHPNENFARELLELFTMGPGPYTEVDVREAARAFTGFHLANGKFEFSAPSHDDGEKQVLGARGRFHGDDVVRLASEHPRTALFMARKLARWLLADDAAEEVVAEIASTWAHEAGHVGRVVRAIFTSASFFRPEHRLALTRAPAALCIATVRALGAALPARDLARHCQAMGQTLLDPPTVKGYGGGRGWINPATLLARRSFLLEAARRTAERGTLPSFARNPADDALREALFVVAGTAAPVEVVRGIRRAAQHAGQDGPLAIVQSVLCHPDFQRC